MRKYTFVFVLLGLMLFRHLFLHGAQEASFPLPQTIKEAQDALDLDGWFTIVIFVLTFIGLVTEVRPPDIVMLISTGILVIFGILTPTQFLEGFSNEIIMTIAMLCIIMRAMEVNGLLEVVAKRILSKSKNFGVQMLSMCVPVATASAFFEQYSHSSDDDTHR